MPDAVRPSVLPKGDDGMPRPMPFDCLCFPKAMIACHARRRPTVSASPKAMMACHAQRHSTVCAAQRRCWHATPNFVGPCLLSKGDDGMPHPTSFDRVCCPKAVMSCHARRSPTVCAAQGQWCHAMPDVLRPCVLSKGGDVMPCPTLPIVCAVTGW